jgi:Mor family transcriptional regulator
MEAKKIYKILLGGVDSEDYKREKLKEIACKLAEETTKIGDNEYYLKAGKVLQKILKDDAKKIIFDFLDKEKYNNNEKRYFLDCVCKQLELFNLMIFLDVRDFDSKD